MRLKKIEYVGVYIVSIVAILWTFFPVYDMIMTSFKTYADVWVNTYLPPHPTFDSYIQVVTQSYFRVTLFWTWLWNSVRIAFGVMAVSVLLAICTGYIISKRITFRFNSEFQMLTLLVYILPAAFLSLPLYQLMGFYNLLNTDWAVILTISTLVTPWCSWMMAEYFSGIPKEIDEAAAIDGASHFRILTRILLPIAAPALVAVMTYSFMYSWNQYLYPLIMLSSDNVLTLPVRMGFFLGQEDAAWNVFFAVGVIYSIPAVIFYYSFKKYLVTGMFRGAVKG